MAFGNYSDRSSHPATLRANAQRATATRPEGGYMNPATGRPNPAPKRRKEVYPTDEIAHLWAAQSPDVPSARNPGGNFYFSGPTIYSYGSHFPTGHFATYRGEGWAGPARGTDKFPRTAPEGVQARAVLLTSRKYSTTTSGHVSSTRHAVDGHAVDIFNVPHVCPDRSRHAENLKHYRDRIAELWATTTGNRGSARRVLANVEQAGELAREANRYAAFFGITLKKSDRIDAPELTPERAAELQTRADAEVVRAAARGATREEKYRQRRERADAQELAAFARWLADPIAPAHSCPYTFRQDPRAVTAMAERGAAEFLRWRGCDQSDGCPAPWCDRPYAFLAVERMAHEPTSGAPDPERCTYTILTSKGARVSAEDGRKLWAIVERCKRNGQTYTVPPDAPINAGPYSLNTISANGHTKIGCHIIPYAEAARIAWLLQWPGAPDVDPAPGVPVLAPISTHD